MINRPQKDLFNSSEDSYTFEENTDPSQLADMPFYYEEQKERWWGIFLNPVGVIFLAGVVAALLVGAWFVLSPSTYDKHQVAKDIPIVKAENTEYKTLPEDEGGLKVEHQDKEVYKRIADGTSAVEPVAIKSEEKPLEIEDEDSVPAANAKVPSDKNSSTFEKKEELSKLQKQEAVLLKKKSHDSEEETDLKVAENLVPPDAVLEAHKPKALDHAKALEQSTNRGDKKTTTGLSSGKFVVKVASFRKKSTAQKELKRVLETFPALLKGVGNEVRVLTTKTSGEFFVPMVGSFKTLEAAKKVANALEAKNFSVSIARAPL